MKRYGLIGLGILVGVGVTPLAAAETTGSAQGKKPNVIVILTDDHGYADLGVQGATDIKTPNIDSLGRNGIRFTQGYVNCPLCGPSRAALLTGRYQNRFGYEVNSGPRPAPNFGLPPDQKTVAAYLKESGYATGAIGKWHLGVREECRPLRFGFDEFYGFLSGARSYYPLEDTKLNDMIRRGDTPVTETRYLTYAFNDEAVSFIDRHKEKPFFLYLAYNAIHDPMHGVKEKEKDFPGITDPLRLTMATMLGAVDDGVGRILEKLRKEGLEENTMIFFLSDNGGPTRANSSRNTPLRGAKGQVLEGGIRVPFLVQWKGKLPAGKTYEKPVIALDILPTALAAAGASAAGENGKRLEGVNLLAYLVGENPGQPHDQLFWRFGNQYAARSGDWKLVKSEGQGPRLFNLAQDIREERDLSKENPEMAAKLQAAYDAWNKENIPPAWKDSRDRSGPEMSGGEDGGASPAEDRRGARRNRRGQE